MILVKVPGTFAVTLADSARPADGIAVPIGRVKLDDPVTSVIKGTISPFQRNLFNVRLARLAQSGRWAP